MLLTGVVHGEVTPIDKTKSILIGVISGEVTAIDKTKSNPPCKSKTQGNNNTCG